MSIKTTTTILCLSLALAACGDSGEVTDPAPVDLGTDFLGDGESTTADGAGIAGQMPVDVGSDDSGDIGDAGALPSDVATDDEGLAIDDGTDSTDTTDTDTDAVDTVDSDTTEADDTVPVVPATGGRVILPGDCEIVATDANLQFCLSPSAGNRVFALDADDNLRWTTTLSEQNDRDSALLVPGNDLFVLRPQNDNNVVLTALDSVGDVEYEAVLTGDMNVLVEGFFEAPNLFLHSKNSIGDSSVLQIDGSTGRQNLVRSFPGETIESIGIEDLDGTRFLTVISGGVTSYLTMDTLEPFTRIFTLDPTNFQQAFPAQMATLRGSYMADFFSVLNHLVKISLHVPSNS